MTSFQLIRGSKRAPNTDVVSAALIAVLRPTKADVEKLEAMLAAEHDDSRLRETKRGPWFAILSPAPRLRKRAPFPDAVLRFKIK